MVGQVGDFGCAIVANFGIQGRYKHQGLLERLLDFVLIGLEVYH